MMMGIINVPERSVTPRIYAKAPGSIFKAAQGEFESSVLSPSQYPPLRALACRRTFITHCLSFHYNDDYFIFYRLACPHHVRKGFLPHRQSVSRPPLLTDS